MIGLYAYVVCARDVTPADVVVPYNVALNAQHTIAKIRLDLLGIGIGARLYRALEGGLPPLAVNSIGPMIPSSHREW
jgi:hypothetical protein